MLPLEDLVWGWPLHWKPVSRLAPALRAQVEHLTRGAPRLAWVLRAHVPLPFARALMSALLLVIFLALVAAARVGLTVLAWTGFPRTTSPWWWRVAGLLAGGVLMLVWTAGMYWVLQEMYDLWNLVRHPEHYFIAFLEPGILVRRGMWAGFLPWSRVVRAEAALEHHTPHHGGLVRTSPVVRLWIRGWPFGYVFVRAPWVLNARETRAVAAHINAWLARGIQSGSGTPPGV